MMCSHAISLLPQVKTWFQNRRMKHKKLQRKTQEDSGGDAALSDCDSSRQLSPIGHAKCDSDNDSDNGREIDVVSDDDIYSKY